MKRVMAQLIMIKDIWLIRIAKIASIDSLSNSCQHSANADVIANVKSKVIVSQWLFFANKTEEKT